MITYNNIGYMGRFGNQMFQFASTVGIARRLGFDPVFPLERFQTDNNPNSYDGCKLLECFKIPEKMIRPSNEIFISYFYHENKFGYNQETEILPDGTTIHGYFQTEKYFKFIKSEIKEIFSFRDEIIENGNKYGPIENGVSLHIRRGDYLTSSDYHTVQSTDYYMEAIKQFDSKSKFYIFSDDPQWCSENLKIENSEVIDTGSPYIDMYLMSLCEGHIIANSSFSWWGAWLANSKKTIAPSSWFGPSMNKDTSDVYCEGWGVI
jgi:hypothetical protein